MVEVVSVYLDKDVEDGTRIENMLFVSSQN